MPEQKMPYITPTCKQVEELPSYPWEALGRRLESIGRQLAVGTHLVVIRVMVHDGKPKQWLKPEVMTLEPRASGRQFLDLLANGDGDERGTSDPP